MASAALRGRTRKSRAARSLRTTVGCLMLSMSFRPTRAYSGVTSPSHRLLSRGVNSGTGIISRLRRRCRAYSRINVGIRQLIGAADLDDRAAADRDVQRLDEILDQILDRNRLGEHGYPPRSDHHGQVLAQGADHLERQAARSDDDRGTQFHGWDSGVAEDVSHGMPAAQVRRQVAAVFAESAQIDDAGDAGGARGRGEVPRPHRLPFLEAARVPHRVDEVICDIDAFERRSQGRRIQDVAGDHARAGTDAGREIRRMTSETAHLVPLCLRGPAGDAHPRSPWRRSEECSQGRVPPTRPGTAGVASPPFPCDCRGHTFPPFQNRRFAQHLAARHRRDLTRAVARGAPSSPACRISTDTPWRVELDGHSRVVGSTFHRHDRLWSTARSRTQRRCADQPADDGGSRGTAYRRGRRPGLSCRPSSRGLPQEPSPALPGADAARRARRGPPCCADPR